MKGRMDPKTLHRDMPLPCGFRSDVAEEPVKENPIKQLRTRQQVKITDTGSDDEITYLGDTPIKETRFTKIHEIPKRHTVIPQPHGLGKTH